MVYEINGGIAPPINFAPATIAEEVMQNVRMIISTVKYSVPMDREFGIDGAVIPLRDFGEAGAIRIRKRRRKPNG